jgi:2-iminoacetate synthase
MTHIASRTPVWHDPARLRAALEQAAAPDPERVAEILAKAALMKGLDAAEVAVLTGITDPAQTEALFAAAHRVKEEIYGRRMVFFAPMYISNLCSNECLYCAFRASNTEVVRHTLTMDQIKREAEILIDQGHKRVLMVAGESYKGGFGYVLDAIRAIYSVKRGSGEIRRVNANLAPLHVEQFKQLHEVGIGTYQLFQETYDPEIYRAVHLGGRKADFDWRVTAFDRAMEAGIDDIGMGVLFGLADWRFEVLALMSHIAHLEERFGVGCHTISVPRLEPAIGSSMASSPPRPVSDEDFKKLVAILRLAVPYTGLIMSTRENARMRQETYALGVSQISAGSRTNPGGYADAERFESSQFQLGDHRSLEEVVQDIAKIGYIPSFCTACYRVGRTGGDFMDLAKTGEIKEKCTPNAVGTFLEYLLDYAAPDTLAAGEIAIKAEIARMDEKESRVAQRMVDMVRAGKRDVFC